MAGRFLVAVDLQSHFRCNVVEVGLVADIEILTRVGNLVPDARFEVLDSHLVEGCERRKLLESYVALNGGQAVALSILHHIEEWVFLHRSIIHRLAHLGAASAI